MALILPSYYKKNSRKINQFTDDTWYVIKSECDEIGQEIQDNVKPMYRGKFELAMAYKIQKVMETISKGYEVFDDSDKNMTILKYTAGMGLPIIGVKQYMFWAIFSKSEANSMRFIKWTEEIDKKG